MSLGPLFIQWLCPYFMKKILIISIVFCSIAWSFNACLGQGLDNSQTDQVDSGMTLDSSSSVSSGGSSFGVSDGVNYFQDSLTINCDDSAGTTCSASPLISTSTPYTILAITVVSGFGLSHGYIDDLKCGSVSIGGVHMLQNVYKNLMTAGVITESSVVAQTSYPIHCSQNLTTTGYSGYYFIQYVPYDTRVSGSELTPTSNSSYMVLLLLFLFILALIDFARRLFGLNAERY